jgi:hypothetical protein
MARAVHACVRRQARFRAGRPVALLLKRDRPSAGALRDVHPDPVASTADGFPAVASTADGFPVEHRGRVP